MREQAVLKREMSRIKILWLLVKMDVIHKGYVYNEINMLSYIRTPSLFHPFPDMCDDFDD